MTVTSLAGQQALCAWDGQTQLHRQQLERGRNAGISIKRQACLAGSRPPLESLGSGNQIMLSRRLIATASARL